MAYTKVEYEKLSAKQLAILHECFRRGNLTRLLHPRQAELKEFFLNSSSSITVFNIARQFGKSFLSAVLAIEHAIRHPKSRILYLAPTAAQARDIILPKIRDILLFCPPDYEIRSRRNEQWTFPNGSEILLRGVDRNPEKVRGQSPHLVILDEAGLCSNLDYVVNSVILPSFNATKGRLLIVSTPATTAGHPFRAYILDALKAGAYQEAKWHENPFLDEDWLRREVLPKYPGGEDNPKFRIEYLADYNVEDTEFRVTPVFDADAHAAFFADYVEPEVFQPYVGIDFGYHPHHSAVVFGFLDFRRATFIVQDEFHAGQLTSRQLAEAIMAKEAELWGNRPSHLPRLNAPLRYCDNNSPMTVADFVRDHGISVVPVQKKSQDEMLNRLNLSLDETRDGGARIRVHPRCERLTFELQNGLWNRTRTDYEKQRDGTHLDCLDALKYLNLNIDWRANPFTRVTFDPTKVFVPVAPRPGSARDKLFNL